MNPNLIPVQLYTLAANRYQVDDREPYVFPAPVIMENMD